MDSKIRAITFVAAVAAATTAPSNAGARGAAAEGCSPGMHPVTVAGQPGYTFCGPASAVVHMQGRALRFSNGLCHVVSGMFNISIGTLVPALRTGKPPSFAITTHTAKAGKQLNAAVVFASGGRGYAVADQVVILAPGLSGGTFSGRILGSATTVTGSFKC
jgi:hypothetical protein